MRLLAELNEEGMTIIFVTHDPRMAEFARRLIHICDGRLANGDNVDRPKAHQAESRDRDVLTCPDRH
jgi:ABC-type lipoprotein export system ATPase subunit